MASAADTNDGVTTSDLIGSVKGCGEFESLRKHVLSELTESTAMQQIEEDVAKEAAQATGWESRRVSGEWTVGGSHSQIVSLSLSLPWTSTHAHTHTYPP
jgi:hypothetical protein